MSNKNKTQNALLEAISIMIDKKLYKLDYNYYVDGVIKTINSDNTYDVLINNTIYKNIPSKHKLYYSVGDSVQILIKNGNWNKKFINGASHNNNFITSTQYNSVDGNGNIFPAIRHNGIDLWIGSNDKESKHHFGKVFISSGYNQETNIGNETVYICVPNKDNNNCTEYKVLHSGNIVDYIYPINSVFFNVENNNPQNFLGGVWESVGNDLFNGVQLYAWKRIA